MDEAQRSGRATNRRCRSTAAYAALPDDGRYDRQAGRARPNREGKPWKRTDGRWQARAYPPGGGIDTRPRYVYGKTRREAMDKRADLEAKLAQGLPEDPHQTVADAFARWLGVTLPQYVRAGRLAASTMDSYRDNARLHILSARDGLGHIRLAELSADTVREWQDRLSRKPSGRQPRHTASQPRHARCHRAPSRTAGRSSTR